MQLNQELQMAQMFYPNADERTAKTLYKNDLLNQLTILKQLVEDFMTTLKLEGFSPEVESLLKESWNKATRIQQRIEELERL